MGIYYPGDGRTVYFGQDRIDRINQLRDEARQHKEASDTYFRIGYRGHAASEGQEAVRKAKEATMLELDNG